MIFWQKYRLELRSSMNGRSDDQISPTANRCARSAKAEFQTYTTHPSLIVSPTSRATGKLRGA